MVVDNDPNYEKKKQLEEKLILAEDLRKQAILKELQKERSDILCLALMYVKNFEELGYDITRCIINANQNAEILEAAYKKGVDDTIMRMRRGEIK